MQNEALLNELDREAALTRKLLEKIPDDKLSWQAHEKSYKLGVLAGHLSEIPSWLEVMLQEDELDFATMDYTPPKIETNSDILDLFDKNLAKGKAALQKATDEAFNGTWRMRHGENIFFELPRWQVVRTWVYSHTVHHRAQLGVYLRLLNIPLPSIYGPTADEKGM